MIKILRSPEPSMNDNLKLELDKIENLIRIDQINNRKKNDFSDEISYSKGFLLKDIKKLDYSYFLKLLNDFNGKCAFCEKKLGDESMKILRYRAEKYYYWLSYEWTNLYISCDKCRYFKGSQSPVLGKRIGVQDNIRNEIINLIDPCVDTPSEHLFFNENGKISPKTVKGKQTIEVFQLNRSELIIKRIEEINIYNDNKFDFSIIKKLNFKGLLRQNLVYDFFKEPLKIQHSLIYNYQNDFSEIFGEEVNIRNYNRIFNKYYIETIIATKKLKADIISEGTYISGLKINNIRGIRLKHKFDYSNKIPYLMFLGENGVGKTSILQALSLALVGEHKDFRIKSQNFLDNLGNYHLKGNIDVSFEDSTLKNSVEFIGESKIFNINLSNTLTMAYGSTRLVSKNLNRINSTESPYNVIHIFPTSKYSYYLPNFQSWIKNDKDILKVNEALYELFYDESFSKMKIIYRKSTREFEMTIDNEYISLDNLSSGYRSIVLLILDIMRIICQNDKDDLGRHSKGIVIIDEIDAHLHPSWKVKIVDNLRRIFPLIQFIMSTHDPLCLRGLTEEEIIVIQKNGEIEKNQYNQRAMEIDQLLTSGLFGLESTLDSKLNNALEDKNLQLNRGELEKGSKEIIGDLNYFGLERNKRIAYEIIDQEIKRRKNNEQIINDPEIIEKVLKLWGLK